MNGIAILAATSIVLSICVSIIIIWSGCHARWEQPRKKIISAIIDFDENTYLISMKNKNFYINELNYYVDNYVNLSRDDCDVDFLPPCYFDHYDIRDQRWGFYTLNSPWLLFRYPHFLPQRGYTSVDQLQSNMPVELAEIMFQKFYDNESTNYILIYCSSASKYTPFQGWSVDILQRIEDPVVAAQFEFDGSQLKYNCSLWSPDSAGEYTTYIEFVFNV